MKKIVFIVLSLITVLTAFIISSTIDPKLEKAKTIMKDFHGNIGNFVYMDEDLKSFISSDLSDEAMAETKPLVEAEAAKITALIDAKILNNILGNVDSEQPDVVKAKTKIVIETVQKEMLPIMKDTILKILPEAAKQAYQTKIIVKADKLANFVQETADGMSVGSKKAIKYLILFLILGVAGGLFIFFEMKARKTGEIESSQIA
ncbi:MAG TPA: hypothetical protein DHW82_09435 [Spirochaetia bacterium]|nr:MAG: hypothetical protein A2Y41_01650 [Spirochaetes bacterium GWB1_36_13]HCL57213.1 hypothetical protein [Spirochaetia bacterium]